MKKPSCAICGQTLSLVPGPTGYLIWHCMTCKADRRDGATIIGADRLCLPGVLPSEVSDEAASWAIDLQLPQHRKAVTL